MNHQEKVENSEKKKKTIKVYNKVCVICEINDVIDGYSICNDCSKEEDPKICTCDKKLNEKPETVIINGEYLKIEKVSQFPKLLKKWSTSDKNMDYFIMECCRGCKFIKKDIETKYEIAEKSAITACIFKKFENIGEITNSNSSSSLDAMVYCGDSLDDDFVSYLQSIGKSGSTCINLMPK